MKTSWYAYGALVCAIWFALTSWLWTYLFNIFFSYPLGLVALLIYFYEKKRDPDSKTNKWVLVALIVGWLSSIVSILILK